MPADGPAWLDQVLGLRSPPFTFRNGGSAIVAGPAGEQRPAKQSAAAKPSRSPPKAKPGV
jgi:hypothetical protein